MTKSSHSSRKLKDVADIIGGIPAGYVEDGNELYMLTGKDAGLGGVTLINDPAGLMQKSMKNGREPDKWVVKQGDVIINARGVIKVSLLHELSDKFTVIASPNNIIVRMKEPFSGCGGWIAACLDLALQTKRAALVSGGNLPIITKATVQNFEVSIPAGIKAIQDLANLYLAGSQAFQATINLAHQQKLLVDRKIAQIVTEWDSDE